MVSESIFGEKPLTTGTPTIPPKFLQDYIPNIAAFVEESSEQKKTDDLLVKSLHNKTIRNSVHDLLAIYSTLMQTIYLTGPYYLSKGKVVKSTASEIDSDVKADAINVIRNALERLHEITGNKDLWATPH